MTEILLPGTLHRESEFTNGLNGTCGPCAAHTAFTWSSNSYISTYQVYLDMRNHNPQLCGANGISTIWGLQTVAQTLGYSVPQFYGPSPWSDNWSGWQAFLNTALANKRATVLELAHGQALRDWITGNGENAVGLTYHYICVVGYNSGGPSARPEAAGKTLPAGWWVADGDNYDSGNVLQFVAESDMAAAYPCAALAIDQKVQVTTPMGIPTGWKDDGTTLTAPNAKNVVHGFRFYVLNNPWPASLIPVDEEYGVPTGDRQDFSMALQWDKASGTIAEFLGTEFGDQLAALHSDNDTLNQKLATADQALATANAAVAAAQGQVAQLTTELDAANAKIAQLEATGGSGPLPADALAAVNYVKALVAQEAANAAVAAAQSPALVAFGGK